MDRSSSPIARHFAALMARLAPLDPPLVQELAARLIEAGEGGDVCLDLHAEAIAEATELAPLLATLRQSAVVGQPGEWKPLILDAAGRLYLYRQWQEEQSLADELLRRSQGEPEIDLERLRDGLGRLFPDGAADEQARAAETALRKGFCVISGGPGTGKTTTVVKVLALLLEQFGPGLRIALTAPTGKAAARLRESIERARDTLACAPEIRAAIPSATRTLHRLLGAGRRPGEFRHDRNHSLPFEVVVVDEASMVNLALMSRLVAALPPSTRLILLGDRDQLASVEAGAVLADLCAGRGEIPPGPPLVKGGEGLATAIVTLRKSHRFVAGGGIGELCGEINAGEGTAALARLRGADPSVSWRELPAPEGLGAALAEEVATGFGAWLKLSDPAAALHGFSAFMVLCALRQGPYGAPALSQTIERLLARRGLIDSRTPWYAGRPVMITRNDPAQELFNGDIGITLPDPEDHGQLKVWFPGSDHALRKLAPSRLGEHETAFAMTVHKSQGSEFDRVLLLLPAHRSEVLSRELVYTAVSRARQSVAVWGRDEVFLDAVARRVERNSGLRDKLWGAGSLD